MSVNKFSIVSFRGRGTDTESHHRNWLKLAVKHHETCQASAVKEGKVRRLEERLDISSSNASFCIVQGLIPLSHL